MFRLCRVSLQCQIVISLFTLYFFIEFYICWEFSINNLQFLYLPFAVFQCHIFPNIVTSRWHPCKLQWVSYLLLFSLNFLIYCVAGRQFRTGLRQMLRLNSTPSLNEVRLWNGILNSPFSFMTTMGLQLQWVWTKLLDNMRAIVLWMFQFILFEVKTFTSKNLFNFHSTTPLIDKTLSK